MAAWPWSSLYDRFNSYAHYQLCAAVFHQWLHAYCILKRQCLWLVGVTFISKGTPQIVVQRCQIASPRWPNDISSATANAIFKNRTQNIEFSFGCVAVWHAIDCYDLSLLLFQENGAIMPLDQNQVIGQLLFRKPLMLCASKHVYDIVKGDES